MCFDKSMATSAETPKGSYSDRKVAVLCPKGQYQPLTGQESCLLCPNGYTTEGVGSEDVRDCNGMQKCLAFLM